MQKEKQFWFHAMLKFLWSYTINTNQPRVVRDTEKVGLGLGIIAHSSGSGRFKNSGGIVFYVRNSQPVNDIGMRVELT